MLVVVCVVVVVDVVNVVVRGWLIHSFIDPSIHRSIVHHTPPQRYKYTYGNNQLGTDTDKGNPTV